MQRLSKKKYFSESQMRDQSRSQLQKRAVEEGVPQFMLRLAGSRSVGFVSAATPRYRHD